MLRPSLSRLGILFGYQGVVWCFGTNRTSLAAGVCAFTLELSPLWRHPAHGSIMSLLWDWQLPQHQYQKSGGLFVDGTYLRLWQEELTSHHLKSLNACILVVMFCGAQTGCFPSPWGILWVILNGGVPGATAWPGFGLAAESPRHQGCRLIYINRPLPYFRAFWDGL